MAELGEFDTVMQTRDAVEGLHNLESYSSVPLMHCDPSDLGSVVIIFRIIPKERTVCTESQFERVILKHFKSLKNVKELCAGWQSLLFFIY